MGSYKYFKMALLAFAAIAFISAPAMAQNVNEDCSNGVQDGKGKSAEECEDFNASDNDDCLGDCTLAFCGDGLIHDDESDDDLIVIFDAGVAAPLEECDDGNTTPGDGCDENCLNEGDAACGDGILQAGEDCDDGNTVDADGCSADCLIEGCGNGLLEEGEECDDGNSTDSDICENDCEFNGKTSCGDGVVDAPETCDDGSQCTDGTDCTEDESVCVGIGDDSCRTRDGDGCTHFCIDESAGGGGASQGSDGCSLIAAAGAPSMASLALLLGVMAMVFGIRRRS